MAATKKETSDAYRWHTPLVLRPWVELCAEQVQLDLDPAVPEALVGVGDGVLELLKRENESLLVLVLYYFPDQYRWREFSDGLFYRQGRC